MIQEITSPKNVPHGVWRLAALKGKNTITDQGSLIAGPRTQVWTGASKEELEAFAATLPPYKSPREQGREYFLGLPSDVKTAFAGVFQVLNALQSDAEVIRGLTALSVPPDLEMIKTELLRLLSGS